MLLQKVISSSDYTVCSSCGKNLMELGNFTYTGATVNGTRYKDERCICKDCGTPFTLHYDFFDPEGHINPFVFSGDVNDLSVNWQDELTAEQQIEIGNHLNNCPVCKQRLEEEILSEARLAAIIHKSA